MKYLFLFLLLVGCKDDDTPAAYYKPKDTFDKCSGVQRANCGMTLYNCNSGKQDYCEHEVESTRQ